MVVACAPQPASDVETTAGTAMDAGVEAPAQPAAMGSPAALADIRCEPSARMPVEDRTSPYDSTAIPLGDTQALICYGRPSLRGRTMIGGQNVPYGRLWRTGANEPTILHTPVPLEIAGIMVEPGSYSLYTIPGEDEWTLIVNRSTSQWGVEGQYTEEVRAQEVARTEVPSERIEEPVEMFTIRAVPEAGAASEVLLEWQNTRVRIPVERG